MAKGTEIMVVTVGRDNAKINRAIGTTAKRRPIMATRITANTAELKSAIAAIVLSSVRIGITDRA